MKVGSCPSEGLTLRVLCGADGTVAVQSHGIVVERGDAGLAARQTGGHVAGTAVRTHTVVAVDVGGVRHRFLQGSHTHTHTGATQVTINRSVANQGQRHCTIYHYCTM